MWIGGDSTYLKAAGIIDNNQQPLLGINSDPTRRTGALCNLAINYENREEDMPKMIEKIQNEAFKYFYRSRAIFSIENPITNTFTNKLCLNEVFVAEKDVA
jgi:NAD kinase